MKTSLLVIDMQRASFARPTAVYDAEELIQRLNALASRVRDADGQVIYMQFTGPPGTPYHADEPGWQLVEELLVTAADVRLSKPGSDSFGAPELPDLLGDPKETRVVITGCDTEYCVDSSIRSALSLGYRVTVPGDGHSLTDRPHLTAPQIIQHHNAIWSTPGAFPLPIKVCPCSEILPG